MGATLFSPHSIQPTDSTWTCSSGRVKVSGAKGRPPTAYYKVSNTYFGNVRMVAMIMIGGIEARNKAAAVAEAIVPHSFSYLLAHQIPIRFSALVTYSRSVICLTMSELPMSCWALKPHTVRILLAVSCPSIDPLGPLSRLQDSREVLLRLVFVHSQKKALESIVAKEITPSALSMAPGITGGVRLLVFPLSFISHVNSSFFRAMVVPRPVPNSFTPLASS